MAALRFPNLLLVNDGEQIHARVLGPLNRETTSVIQQRLDQAVCASCRRVHLDLGAAEYVDSDGIRWLQRIAAEWSARQVELRLEVREGCRADRTFQLLQLDHEFHVDRYPLDSPLAPPHRPRA